MGRKVLVLSVWLWLFWIILTASFRVANLFLGLVCSVLTAVFVSFMLGSYLDYLKISLSQTWRFLCYIPFLVKAIVLANFDVAERVLDPNLPISPLIIKFKFPLKKHLAQVMLANSITLTPGTFTVDISDDVFYIHCLAEEHVESILEGSLQKHIIQIFEGA